jgi:hypothetical protein
MLIGEAMGLYPRRSHDQLDCVDPANESSEIIQDAGAPDLSPRALLATGPDFEYRPSADPGCGDFDPAGFPRANPTYEHPAF